jgi:anthranilate synthase
MSVDISSVKTTDSYLTQGGITIHRERYEIPLDEATEPIRKALDGRKGVLFTSGFDYPGRYTRWDIGFTDPPLEIVSRGRDFQISALNGRGCILLSVITNSLDGLSAVEEIETSDVTVIGTVKTVSGRFSEEQRSKQPSVFSVLRALLDLFYSAADPHLGLYGAFGYDLAFQFEPLRPRIPRLPDQRDLVLYLPDTLINVDHRRDEAVYSRYEFEVDGYSTCGLSRAIPPEPYIGADTVPIASDHAPGEYADQVRQAHEAFKRGDLFEVVPGQTFYEPCPVPPSELFRRLRERNPAPYGFFINLGQAEYLVGASPEMYIRVEGDRVESCPISGTISRGRDPIGDAHQIRELLNSAKDEHELTMCTDVDRNDKSRICVPGSVRVIGRRQIEMYSKLIHTVDHVEGRLREEFDALDAFLAHAWAVTVTGAPKVWAMQFLEDHEKTPRAWYGGAVGLVGFNGNLNTGLTLRTIRVKDGVAQIRAGATLLYDSDPEEEEQETHLKASALFDVVQQQSSVSSATSCQHYSPGKGKRIILVDHQDSFVHTLANYFRQTGAEVTTLRAGFPPEEFDALCPDLVVLSPGPGRPQDFDVNATLAAAIERDLPVFGVCLGLQGIVEYFGGQLDVLPYPAHGIDSPIRLSSESGSLFAELPIEFTAGRYHSLFAVPEKLPTDLKVTALSEDGIVMAIEHVTLPIAAVQFHPESILSLGDDFGIRLIRNVVVHLADQT